VAEIDIQEKQRSSWLGWSIGLVVAALLVWWIVAANTRDDAIAAAGPDMTPMAVAMTTPPRVITDLTTLTGAIPDGDLAGQMVMLPSVSVVQAISDKAFWAGNGTVVNENVLVVRGNQTASYTAADGAVQAGKRVMIYGTVQDMPSNPTQLSTEWNLASTDRQAVMTRPLYVLADSVRIAP